MRRILAALVLAGALTACSPLHPTTGKPFPGHCDFRACN